MHMAKLCVLLPRDGWRRQTAACTTVNSSVASVAARGGSPGPSARPVYRATSISANGPPACARCSPHHCPESPSDDDSNFHQMTPHNRVITRDCRGAALRLTPTAPPMSASGVQTRVTRTACSQRPTARHMWASGRAASATATARRQQQPPSNKPIPTPIAQAPQSDAPTLPRGASAPQQQQHSRAQTRRSVPRIR